jgi:type IV secretion system protein VirB10
MTPVSRAPRAEAPSENVIADATQTEGEAPSVDTHIAGDRGVPPLKRAGSIQARVSRALAIALMTVLCAGALSWYYTKIANRPAQARQLAQAAVKNRAQGEMPLPKIPHVQPPFVRNDAAPAAPPASDAGSVASTNTGESTPMAERFLGSAPPPPPPPAPGSTAVPYASTVYPQAAGPPQKSPGELAFERRLAGPAFAHASSEGGMVAPAMFPAQGLDAASPPVARARAAEEGADALNVLLRPSVTPAVAASVLPTRRFLLAKGTFIDCTLETAIDSTLPGMTTCVTATDTWSSDGSVVLLERGTKLVGETRGQVAQGTSRIFVLWNEARTPTGVVVPLASPGTDELGRSGLAGVVNRHFWDRFGAAILLTVVSGAVQGAVNSQNNGGSLVVTPSTSTDVMTEVLKSTVNIPPTVSKAQGDRIQVFVARDVDFRPVYALEMANAAQTKEPRP